MSLFANPLQLFSPSVAKHKATDVEADKIIAYIIKSEYEPKQVIQMTNEWLSKKIPV